MDHPNEEQLAALRRFARRHGQRWKHALRLAWETGRDENLHDGALLRQVRNQFGPAWLLKTKL